MTYVPLARVSAWCAAPVVRRGFLVRMRRWVCVRVYGRLIPFGCDTVLALLRPHVAFTHACVSRLATRGDALPAALLKLVKV